MKPFELIGDVTQHIINTSDIMQVFDCIGYHTVREALYKADIPHTYLSWGTHTGTARIRGDLYKISTEPNVCMPILEEPCQVKLKFELHEEIEPFSSFYWLS